MKGAFFKQKVVILTLDSFVNVFKETNYSEKYRINWGNILCAYLNETERIFMTDFLLKISYRENLSQSSLEPENSLISKKADESFFPNKNEKTKLENINKGIYNIGESRIENPKLILVNPIIHRVF